MSPRSLRRLATMLAAGAFVLTAGTASPAPEAKRPVVPKLQLEGGPWGYPQPFTYSRGPGLIHTLFVFDSLLWKDGTGRVIPWLARSWGRSRDGFEYRFRLHPQARWHDGRPVTAADVVFTFDYSITGPGKAFPGISGPFDMIDKVSAVGRDTVVFRLKTRFAPFPITVAGRVPIIPQHIWNDVADPARFRDPAAVIGSGPYKLDSYDEASGSYRYVANMRYHLGAPAVRSLEFVPAPDALLALLRGTIDASGPGTEEGVPQGALLPFYRDKRYGVLQAPGEWTRALHFNLTSGFPYDQRAFRQAVAYAINRPELVKRILFGRGAPGSLGGLAPSHPLLARKLPTYAHNPATARRLLGEMGIVDRDSDGKRELPDGKRFQPELLTSSFQSPVTAELVSEWLRGVGLDIQLRSLDRAAADAATAAGRYQMALIGYGGLGGEPDSLRTRYSSQVRSRAFNRVIGYQDARFEELAVAQVKTVRASTRRKQIEEMQQILARDVPAISLYTPTRIHVYRKNEFSAWYFTPGGVFGGYPGALQKHAFVTGKTTGP